MRAVVDADVVGRGSDNEVYGRLGDCLQLQGVVIVEGDLLRFKAGYRFGA